MEKKLSDFTVTELKSIAYDQLSVIDSAQANLRVLNQEIANRIQQSQQQSTAVTTPVEQVNT